MYSVNNQYYRLYSHYTENSTFSGDLTEMDLLCSFQLGNSTVDQSSVWGVHAGLLESKATAWGESNNPTLLYAGRSGQRGLCKLPHMQLECIKVIHSEGLIRAMTAKQLVICQTEKQMNPEVPCRSANNRSEQIVRQGQITRQMSRYNTQIEEGEV